MPRNKTHASIVATEHATATQNAAAATPGSVQCLIIAAGGGSRLRDKGESKPLIPLLGVALIERVIRTAIDAGAEDFYVVVGHEAEQVTAFLDRLARRLRIRITTLLSHDWEAGNGLSVLRAKRCMRGPFLLLMADHLVDPQLIRTLRAHRLRDNEIALGVDSDTTNCLVDLDDVTRVDVVDGKIREIGKGLDQFNGFDTGVFLCSPTIFDVLEHANGDASLSAAIRSLAASDNATAIATSEFWIDVDDTVTFRRAEKALSGRLRDKPNDGPIARHLNRRISVPISRQLAKIAVTPNQISVVSFACSVVAAGLFAFGGYLTLAAGGLLAQFASIIDGCDGEIARLKYQASDLGGWFDAVLDRYADALLLFGLMWHLGGAAASGWVLLAGFMAIIGSFMLSYTADKYDNLMRERVEANRTAGLRLGRDVRVFVVFVGAVANLPFVVLAIIAVAMNVETVRRVKVAFDA